VITNAVVPVAGLGTRLLPASRSAPKEMLPVVDKPVVQYVVEELAAAGIEQLLFVTGRRKRAIEDHFDHDPELDRAADGAPGDGLRILYTRQPRPSGLGDALHHAEGFADGRGVVVALGDAIIEPPRTGPGIVTRLIEAFERTGASAALAVTEVEHVERYGVVSTTGGGDGDGGLAVSDIVEKPRPEEAPSRLAVAARYVLGPRVFAALREVTPDASGEVQLTAALRQVISDGHRVVAVPLANGERRHDIGTIEGYCATFIEHALRHPTLGARLRAEAAALLDDPD
jgi:UTP--glucose-1-phosphate uridylyltransferase